MGWKIRNGMLSDEQLKEKAKCIAKQEAEFRPPSRETVEQRRTLREAWLKRQEAEAKAREELLRKWTALHIKEVRRRNKFIRYELFLFFKEHYYLDGQGAQELTLQVLVAVCKCITKDVALYCQLISEGENTKCEKFDARFREDRREEHEERQKYLHYEQAAYLRYFASYELGIPLDEDDALSLLDAYQQETLISTVISSHLKRHLEDVIRYLDLSTLAPKISGYSDPDIGRQLRMSISSRINSAERDFMLLKKAEDLSVDIENHPQKYVDSVHRFLENKTSQWTEENYTLTPEQLASAKSLLDTPAKIQAYKKWSSRSVELYRDVEWSKSQEGLSHEKDVLSSIVSDSSVQNVLLEKVFDLQLNSNTLVSVTALIRHEIYRNRLFEDKGFDAMYKAALEKHVGYFKEPQKQDPTLKKLFGLDVDKEKRTVLFGIYFGKGFY